MGENIKKRETPFLPHRNTIKIFDHDMGSKFKDIQGYFLKIWFFPGISRIFKEISKIQGSSRKFKNVATMTFLKVLTFYENVFRNILNNFEKKIEIFWKFFRKCWFFFWKIKRKAQNVSYYTPKDYLAAWRVPLGCCAVLCGV